MELKLFSFSESECQCDFIEYIYFLMYLLYVEGRQIWPIDPAELELKLFGDCFCRMLSYSMVKLKFDDVSTE